MRSAAAQSFEDAFAQRRERAGISPLSAFRSQAAARLHRLGLPTMRDESWRYTDVRDLLSTSFDAEPARDPGPIETRRFGEPGWPTITLFNGRPLLSLPRNVEGVEVCTLRELETREPARILELMPAASDDERSRFALVNSALFEDGVLIRLTGACPAPLVIVNASRQAANGVSHPRVIIEAQAGAHATIIEHHVSHAEDAGLVNHVCALHAHDDSRIEHYRLIERANESIHLDHLAVRCGRNAEVRQHTVCIGGALVRANLHAQLAGESAACDCFALISGTANRTSDCAYWVEHGGAGTKSRQTARVIGSGKSRGIFNSEVRVDAGAPKSDSKQSCRGLLLAAGAEIDLRPQLQIYTDDVACVHGATTGRLDPNMMFYLLSRGLASSTAHALLVFAFLAEVLQGMSVPSVRSAIETALIAQLPNADILKEFR